MFVIVLLFPFIFRKKETIEKFAYSIIWMASLGTLFNLSGVLYGAFSVSKMNSISVIDAWQLITGPYDPTMQGTPSYYSSGIIFAVVALIATALMFVFFVDLSKGKKDGTENIQG